MLGRLGRSLPFLTGGSRDLPSRQQTLRDTIGWSYDLLSEEEQRLFRRMGVFVGGCTLEAAERVGSDGEGDPLDLLASLVDKSLVRQVDGPDGEPRFTMLETIREYALEQLEASGEADTIRRRHAEFFAWLAEQAEPELRTATDSRWLDRLESEHANIRVGAGMVRRDRVEARDVLPRIAAGLWMFWWQGGYWSEGRLWQDRAIELADEPLVDRRRTPGPRDAGGPGRRAGAAPWRSTRRSRRSPGPRTTRPCSRWPSTGGRSSASMMGDAERGEAMAREGQALALQSGEPRRHRQCAQLARTGRHDARRIRARACESTRSVWRSPVRLASPYLVPYVLNSLARRRQSSTSDLDRAVATGRRGTGRGPAPE